MKIIKNFRNFVSETITWSTPDNNPDARLPKQDLKFAQDIDEFDVDGDALREFARAAGLDPTGKGIILLEEDYHFRLRCKLGQYFSFRPNNMYDEEMYTVDVAFDPDGGASTAPVYDKIRQVDASGRSLVIETYDFSEGKYYLYIDETEDKEKFAKLLHLTVSELEKYNVTEPDIEGPILYIVPVLGVTTYQRQ